MVLLFTFVWAGFLRDQHREHELFSYVRDLRETNRKLMLGVDHEQKED